MDSQNIMFIVLAVVITLSSVLTVVTRSIMRAATYLFFTLLGTAGLYFLMGYTFLGAVQVMVYAGGIIVLYVFAILLTRGTKDSLSENTKSKIILSAVLSLVGFGLAAYLIFIQQFKAEVLAAPNESVLTMQQIGTNMLSTDQGGYLLPFEAVSVLLLACIVAGLMIARKR
ncbi:MAG: NADH-quinone oxidoreductase subunit J [Bacteroidaceae bacterium]|nr:NADH-quinone oxidoreductase subunit J [Bacteroidaceae bacterium]MDY6249710.1 NADH-quinone oxidoreductase subunit J [Bacteroidaceae bacterium]